MKDKKARDVMTTRVVSVHADTVLIEAIEMLLRYGISGLPVVDDDEKLLGIVCEHDMMNFVFSGDAETTRVKEAMTPDVYTFPPEKTLAEIVNIFASRRIRHVPIAENGRLVGIVSRRDILREMLRIYGRAG